MSSGLRGGYYSSNIFAPGGPNLGGDQIISGGSTVTLSDDLVCNSLTVKDTSSIVTSGYKIFAREFIHLMDDASIVHPGGNGTDGGTNPGDGVGGVAAVGGTVGNSLAGGDSTDTNGVDGVGNFFFALADGTGGIGGDGAGGTGGAGGLGQWFGPAAGTPFSALVAQTAWTFDTTTVGVSPALGGAGGGGGAGAGGGEKGGGGGAGGGVIYVSTPFLILEGASRIESRGGDGGDGVMVNSAGGGSGSGGVVILNVFQILLKSSSCLITASPGTPGLGNGTGTNGTAGTFGWVYVYSEAGSERAAQFLGSQHTTLPQKL